MYTSIMFSFCVREWFSRRPLRRSAPDDTVALLRVRARRPDRRRRRFKPRPRCGRGRALQGFRALPGRVGRLRSTLALWISTNSKLLVATF